MLARKQLFFYRAALLLSLLGPGNSAVGAINSPALQVGENLALEQIIVPLPPGGAFFEEFALFSLPAGFTGFSFRYFNPLGTMEVRTFEDLQGLGDPLSIHLFPPTENPADLSFEQAPADPPPPDSFAPAEAILPGTAHSIVMRSRGPGGFWIKDLVLETPTGEIPEPGPALLTAAGILVLGLIRLRPRLG